jgi:hypothetical protein
VTELLAEPPEHCRIWRYAECCGPARRNGETSGLEPRKTRIDAKGERRYETLSMATIAPGMKEDVSRKPEIANGCV